MNDDTLLALAERCEKALGPDHELDGDIEVELRRLRAFEVGLSEETRAKWRNSRGTIYDNSTGYDAPRVTASVERALALVPTGGKWSYDDHYTIAEVHQYWSPQHAEDSGHRRSIGEAGTPALALCAAALRARTQEPPKC